MKRYGAAWRLAYNRSRAQVRRPAEKPLMGLARKPEPPSEGRVLHFGAKQCKERN